MTQETITALPVEPTLVPLMTHFVLSNPGDPTDLSSLAPATIAERLSRIPLPPLLELAAAALSQMHRERGLPDPVYNRIVATAIQRALRLPAPLTVRCVNMASLAHQRTLTNEGRRKAGFSLLTVRLLRETQFNADQLSELTWATLLDPHTPQTESTSTLIEELAPKDLTQRLYPARPPHIDSIIRALTHNIGLGTAYTNQSGPAGTLHDMATAGVLHPLDSPQPTVLEALTFIKSLKQVPLT